MQAGSFGSAPRRDLLLLEPQGKAKGNTQEGLRLYRLHVPEQNANKLVLNTA